MNKNILKRKLFTLTQWTLPNKTIDNCFMRGECGCCNQFNYNHERGVQRPKNTYRATECAMISVGKVYENNLQQKQSSCLTALSPAASTDMNHLPLTTHYSLKRKAAFTLAEVLITLGIIGIVAALTLPVVVTKYKEYVFLNKFKQTYAVISQLYMTAINDNGGVFPEDICDGISNITVCSQKIADMLVEYNNNVTLISKSEAITGSHQLYGNIPDSSPTLNRVWMRFGNGAVIGISGSSSTDVYRKHKYFPDMFVDLNGKKGPNRMGYDQFLLFLKNIKNENRYTISGFDIWWAGPNYCNNFKLVNGWHKGGTCAVWIIKYGNMDYLHRDISSEW